MPPEQPPNPAETAIPALLDLAGQLQRLSIDRLAIETRIEDGGDYPPDTAWRVIGDRWQHCGGQLQQLASQLLEQPATTSETAQHKAAMARTRAAVRIADPFGQAPLTADQLDRWREADFALEAALEADGNTARHRPPGLDIAIDELAALPLLEFYAGLVHIDRSVARMYDVSRYERVMKWALIAGGIVLAVALIVAQFKKSTMRHLPWQGSAGVACGLVLGVILDTHRRHRTRQMVEAWGAQFGCDLKELRWRRLPRFVNRIRRELERLGVGHYSQLPPEQLEAEVDELIQRAGWQ